MASHLVLADGRTLAWTEHGAPGGAPLIHLHGMCSSGLEAAALLHAAALERGVRVIAPDRPGYGGSTPARSYSLIDSARDVAALADALGLERFFVSGYSGGGPHAAACAWAMPERVIRAALVATLASNEDVGGAGRALPWYHPQTLMMAVALRAAWLVALPIRLIVAFARRDVGFLLRRMCEADQRVGERAEVQAWFRDVMLTDALRQGIAGVKLDLWCGLRRWPFALEEVRVPVDLWVGAEDPHCPPAMTQAIARRLRRGRVQLRRDAGHLAFFEQAPEVLDALLDEQRDPISRRA